MSKEKTKLMEGTLGLDEIASYLPNNCDTEVILKIQKKENTYGILSFEFKNEKSESISNVKVFNEKGKEIKTTEQIINN
jgi:hypothetical protein